MCGSPGFSGNLETTVIRVRVAWPSSTESQESLQSSVRSTKPCRVPSVRLESQKWHWRTNSWWRYSTFILARTFVWLLMDTASHCYEFLLFASMRCASQPLRKGWSGGHDSAWCSYSLLVYFTEYFCVIICEFSLRISMNYTENIMVLLTHVQTMDTRCSSPIFWAPGNEPISEQRELIVCKVLLQCYFAEQFIRISDSGLLYDHHMTITWLSHDYHRAHQDWCSTLFCCGAPCNSGGLPWQWQR